MLSVPSSTPNSEMSGHQFETLPNEVIFRIISFVSQTEAGSGSGLGNGNRNAIQAIRLVSRRLSMIAARFLITATRVRLSSESLSRFEQLCSHPTFNQCIKRVEINVAYYDINLAQDRDLYSEHCEPRLARILRLVELSTGWPPGSRDQESSFGSECSGVFETSACQQPREFDHDFQKEESSRGAALEEQILSTLHHEYKSRAADQEHIRKNNRHIDRLCHAMAGLPALESIILTDKVTGPTDSEMIPLHRFCGGLDPLQGGAFEVFLVASGWNGSPTTRAYNTKPPVEMLGELLSRLGEESNVRPSRVALDLGMPLDIMASLPLLTAKQIDGVCKLVSKATDVDISFHSESSRPSTCILPGSPPDNNTNKNAIQSLGSLTMALTNTSSLRSLRMSFFNGLSSSHQKLHHHPWNGISIDMLLSLTPRKWPDIRTLELSYLSCGLEDLNKLVASCRHSGGGGGQIKSFSARALSLSGRGGDGDWDDDITRHPSTQRVQARFS